MVEQHELDTEWALITDQSAVEHAAEALDQGTGPVGVDAERASGFRYGGDAYLVQIYRRGSGTFLFDPTTIETFAPVVDAIGQEEWILHAASQDLECLSALDLTPTKLFDTELASRLLGFERVGLGSIVEQLLGIRLTKSHSAVDWSRRPLPESWLEYAALDVALLPDLRDEVERELSTQSKLDIAVQEFEAVRLRAPKEPASEPWRRLAGGNRLTSPRELAIARELWLARDDLARKRDVAPGRLLPDASIIVAAKSRPRSAGHLASLNDFVGRASRTELDRWWGAILRGKSTDDLPVRLPRDPNAMPHHRNWPSRYPEAAARLFAAREALTALAQQHEIPLENLLVPDLLRRLAWQPPVPLSEESVRDRMHELGARPWQIALTAPAIIASFVEVQ